MVVWLQPLRRQSARRQRAETLEWDAQILRHNASANDFHRPEVGHQRGRLNDELFNFIAIELCARILGAFDYAITLSDDNPIVKIHPIAGTMKRTGNNEVDNEVAKELANDPKENAEHNMLVDLARNDLSKNCTDVQVSKNKVIQYFSHVIHLVSKVIANKPDGVSSFQVFEDTFPAGTLSGAPKYKAIELINKYEPKERGFYGGAIGYVNFNGDMNMAITIRSVLSKNQVLHYQAGAGIVISSKEEMELQEVENKLKAIQEAIKMANNL